MLKIKVPASSANIGPGFDSVGIAVGRYLTLTVSKSKTWQFTHLNNTVPALDNYKHHYIYKTAQKVAKIHDCQVPACTVEMHSDIPLARGLGSSASAIVASIELVNQMCNLNLSADEKLQTAVEIEGHPDNVSPALFGGFIVSVQMDGRTHYQKLALNDVELVIYIPPYELKTSEARGVLPESFPIENATTASAISNLMISSLMSGDYALAGQMMESDLFHEIYRSKLIPQYREIKDRAKQLGAYGTVISGAGPTMISFIPKGNGETVAKAMKAGLDNFIVESIQIDNEGLDVEEV